MLSENHESLKERELKAAAEIAANARNEVSREARGEAIVPVPTEEEQEKHHSLIHPTLHGMHRARQDRHLQIGRQNVRYLGHQSRSLLHQGRPYRYKRSKGLLKKC